MEEEAEMQMQDVPEKEQKSINKAQTVRCEIRIGGDILLLQKNGDSKNPYKWEFPGGNIEDVGDDPASPEQQKTAIIKEVLEETGLDISSTPLNDPEYFEYDYEAKGDNYHRAVNLFRIEMPHGDHKIIIDQTRKKDGSSEDKHRSWMLVTQEVFDRMIQEGEISQNSFPPLPQKAE